MIIITIHVESWKYFNVDAISPTNMASLPSSQRRSYWLKTLHQWHWISAALSLAGLILFAATGLTLNNAAWIEASPKIVTKTLTLPPELLVSLNALAGAQKKGPLTGAAESWLNHQLDIQINKRPAELSSSDAYLSLPEPGADAWLSIDMATGEIEYEHSSRGWIAYFNDLHKGRHAGTVWAWFIDVFAIACLIFAFTGLFLIKLHASNRPASGPVLGLGLLIPFIIMLLFIH